MEQLIVRLGSDATSTVSWLVWSTTESEIIASGELPDADALSTLGERVGHRSVIALVPTSDVLLTWVDLPPRAGRKILAAIPFMLEDDISEDIGELFFAFGPKVADKQGVAVVKHSKMENWMLQLKTAGLSCNHIIPDVLAVPVNPDGMSILSLEKHILVREDQWKGLQGEVSWIAPALSHLTKTEPEPVNIRNYSNVELHSIPNAHIEDETLELPMAVLAKEALSVKFNLFQGDYKVRKQSNSAWKQWRVAAVLAGVVLFASILDKAITLQSLSAKNQSLITEIDSVIGSNFPNAKRARNKRKAITQALASLEQGGGNASVLNMLAQLAPAFSSSSIKPQSIRFDSGRNEIRLQAIAVNFESLEKFKREAESAGFTVDQGAINNRDEGVVGNLVIRSSV